MAMGKKKRRSQKDLWVATSEIPAPPGHPFYEALEELLKEHHFDDFVEQRCAKFCRADGPAECGTGCLLSVLLVGYFEVGERNRLAGGRFTGAARVSLKSAPDHSTLSRTRRLIDVETHGAVFGWVLARGRRSGTAEGKDAGHRCDNAGSHAATRVRRVSEGTGSSLRVETPTRQEQVPGPQAKEERIQPRVAPDSRITKMKDGRTHLGYYAVDLETGAIVAVTVTGRYATMVETLIEAGEHRAGDA